MGALYGAWRLAPTFMKHAKLWSSSLIALQVGPSFLGWFGFVSDPGAKPHRPSLLEVNKYLPSCLMFLYVTKKCQLVLEHPWT